MADPTTNPPSAPGGASGRSLRWLLAVMVVVAAAAVSAWLAARSPTDAGDEPFPVRPPGFWSAAAAPATSAAAGGESAEERARLVSLPYLGGRAPADGDDPAKGVVRHLPGRAWPGVNLYNSGHGPEAILLDMEGEVLHRWRYPFERAFPGVQPTDDTHFFRRVHVFPDGRLLALYQTGGLIFLDRDSRPMGRCAGNFYNDLWVDEEASGGGRVWTLAKEVRDEGRDPTGIGAPNGAEAERLDDFLALLRYEGDGSGCREERRISLTRALERSRFSDLLESRAPRGDVLHANTVVELGAAVAEIAGLPPAFAPGRLLVSLREIDVVAVIDPESETAVWARRGPWRAQHEPSLLADGHLLLFDNRGHRGFARLLEVDPATGEETWSHGGDPPAAFGSAIGGSCARLPNGNTLATLSVPGRALELDPSGEVVWELRTPHRAGPDDGLIAMLFEVQRLPRESIDGWLR